MPGDLVIRSLIEIHFFWVAMDKTRAGEPEPVGAGCFWLLGAGAGVAWKKNRSRSLSRSRLEKKSGGGAAWKKSQEPELEFLRNVYIFLI